MTADSADPGPQPPREDIFQTFGELIASPGNLSLLWRRRGMWQIGFRWAVTPLLVAAVFGAVWLGFELPVVPILAIGAATALYNSVFAWIFFKHRERLRADRRLDRSFTILQVVCDYAAVFLLIHFTGGAWSPLVLFLIFHVIIAGVQFSPVVAHLYAAWAAGGLWLMLLGQTLGWLPQNVIEFRGRPFDVVDRPEYAAVMLLFYTATLFITAAMISQIMRRLQWRVGELTQATSDLALANHKLNGLYTIVRAISAERHLDPILSTVTSQLAEVLDIPAVAVKLLSEDGETLRYVAATGLPDEVTDRVIDVERSPLNQRILAGETLVHGQIRETGSVQLQAELSALGIRSAALAPLRAGDRVIGTLGIYADTADRFRDADADFLRLAAELVAIAIEDARANEAVEELMRERTQFMLEVAHNLRAPLSAGLGMLELVQDSYLGPVNERQTEYLGRIEVRLRSLHRTIGELLTIARTRDWSREIPDVEVNLEQLARQTERTFREEAGTKGLSFSVVAEDDLPAVDSGADLLEQVMENLVSNAIKYTPDKGQVEVRFARSGPHGVRIIVRDTGIGIPQTEQANLFREFFRASNAKKHTREGTGLGLALVKQTVERHGGTLDLESSEGRGTKVTIELPVHRARGAD